MIKDSKIKSVIHRKAQQNNGSHQHHYHDRHHNYHTHHHHPRYRFNNNNNNHLSQHDLKQHQQPHHKDKFHRRQGGHNHIHRLFWEDRDCGDILEHPQRQHSHHHLRLQNNSHYPFNFQKNVNVCSGLQPRSPDTNQSQQESRAHSDNDAPQKIQYQQQQHLDKGSLLGVKRSNSLQNFAIQRVPTPPPFHSSVHCGKGSLRSGKISFHLHNRNYPSVFKPHPCGSDLYKHCNPVEGSGEESISEFLREGGIPDIADQTHFQKSFEDERDTKSCFNGDGDHFLKDFACISESIKSEHCTQNRYSENSQNTSGGSSVDCEVSNTNNNSNSSSIEEIETPTFPGTPGNLADVSTPNPSRASPTMHLPLHASLPDGSHVTIDEADDAQISEMYQMIRQAAMLGEGYGVDEYPTEEDFRYEINGGRNFVVFVADREIHDDMAAGNGANALVCEIEQLRSGRRTWRHGRPRLLAAFSLADSKFYRGNDFKVADPIIIVAKEERRKGIGEFIFRQVVQICRRLGYAGIYTDTFSNNTAMIRIIERTAGFKHVGYLPLGGKMPDGSYVGANIYFNDLRPGVDHE